MTLEAELSVPVQPIAARRPAQAWLFALLVLLVFLLDATGTYLLLTSRTAGAGDFYPRWMGARQLLVAGESPYSDEVTQLIQKGLYHGRVARDDEDQVAFAYPLYAVFFVGPLALLPYNQAQAAWMALLELAVVAGLVLAAKAYGWRPPFWLWATTSVWGVFFYHSGLSVIVGQFSILVFLLVGAALWSIRVRRDVLAGVCLALSTVKPQMVYILIVLLLVWAVASRRWKFPLGFGLTLALLVGGSWALSPGWIAPFMGWMARYSGYTAIGSPLWLLTERYVPILGRPVHFVLLALLIAYMVWSWRRLGRMQWSELLWAAGLALVITTLVSLRTATTNYVVFLLPIVQVFRALSARGRPGEILVVFIQAASLVGLWWLFAATLVMVRGPNESYENPIMYVVTPVILLIILVLMRRRLVGLDEPSGVKAAP